jgi:hypothetical protein
MNGDEARFNAAKGFCNFLNKGHAIHGDHVTAELCKGLMEAAYAKLQFIQGEHQAAVFVGGLTFQRDPLGQTDVQAVFSA